MEMPKDSQAKSSESSTMRILIADDDTPTRMLLRAAISQWGYQIVEAKDGEEAWELMQKFDAPRLLILDWLMPKLDGIALCERIRKEFKFHPYIILLTQMTGSTNIVKGLEAGADEFLSKPFNMAELRSRLSIGSRIITIENKLEEQNKKIQFYISQLESLITPALENTNQVYNLLKKEASPTMIDSGVLLKMENLQVDLQNINTAIKTISPQEKLNK